MSVNNSQNASWEEGVAIDLLERAGGPTPPIDAFKVASALGYEVRFIGGTHGHLDGNVISVPHRVRDTRQHLIVMHEISHDALQRAGIPDTEAAAWYTASAGMLPRREFLRDMQATEWDIRELRAKHVNCSAELIARRICALDDACATIWDQGKLKRRIVSPWLSERLGKISPFERELAGRVYESGETEHAGLRLWGIPVNEGIYRRVITIAEPEQLAMRF